METTRRNEMAAAFEWKFAAMIFGSMFVFSFVAGMGV